MDTKDQATRIEKAVEAMFDKQQVSIDNLHVVFITDNMREPDPAMVPTIYCRREETKDPASRIYSIETYEGTMVKLNNPLLVIVEMEGPGPARGFRARLKDYPQFSVGFCAGEDHAIKMLFQTLVRLLLDQAVLGGFMPADIGLGYHIERIRGFFG